MSRLIYYIGTYWRIFKSKKYELSLANYNNNYYYRRKYINQWNNKNEHTIYVLTKFNEIKNFKNTYNILFNDLYQIDIKFLP